MGGLIGASLLAVACSFFAPSVDEYSSAFGVSGANGQAGDGTGIPCEAGVCPPPASCDDGKTNGVETDTDCGGGACPPCALDASCTRASDCASGFCDVGICATPISDPTCSDGQKNETETDTDCGGDCAPCAVDKRCAKGSDCLSLICSGVCQPPTCSDKVRNGTESDEDCGGSCTGCDLGLGCKANTDCKSASCSNSVCIAPTCMDKSKNGTETGIDCGGSCSACPANQGCSKGSDCQSLICAASGMCTAASCSDGVKNGTESAIDCGKGCSGCKSGQFCNTNADCASATCNQSYCVPTSPTGGSLVSTGWTASASDTYAGLSPADGIDDRTDTHWESGTAQYAGMWFKVDMKSPQIFFGLTLDTRDQPQDFPALIDVYLSMDGTFTTPVVSNVVGSSLVTVSFPSNKAVIARYIKVVLGADKATAWWGLRDMSVNN